MPSKTKDRDSFVARTPKDAERSELTKGVLLSDLDNKQCRFPMWEDGKLTNSRFCGERVVPGKSYCDKHFISTRMNKKAAISFVSNLCNDH